MSDVMVTCGMKLFFGALGKSDGRVLPISSLRDLLKAWSSAGGDEPERRADHVGCWVM